MKLIVKDGHHVATTTAAKFKKNFCEECYVGAPKIFSVMIQRESLNDTTALEYFEHITNDDSSYVLESFVTFHRNEQMFTSSIRVNKLDSYRLHNETATKTFSINAVAGNSLVRSATH